ncbi:MAG: acyltransferase [Actinobacteria bacterium]|nr:acyltransferase [Actinomycetota bacterium]
MQTTESSPEPSSGTGFGRANLTYQAALDGVRAFAVLAVLLYHGDVARVRAGFLGVDIFFVLSGFLITMLLLREYDATGCVDQRRFWTRRARRLLPALFAVVVFVCAYATFAAARSELNTIRLDGIASLLYVQNWRLIVSEQSYFAQFHLPSPFRHMWSLAIEEQWYLIWPIVLPALLRVARGRLLRVALMTAGLGIASALLMLVLAHPGSDPSRAYYGTDTRAQGLLLGALLGIAWTWRPGPTSRAGRAVVQALGLAGAAYLAWMVVTADDFDPGLFAGQFTFVAIAAAALVAAAMTPGVVRVGLALAPLPAIGRISYGLYLWHWPIYLWLTGSRTGISGNTLLALRLLVTFAVAIVSYCFLERPVRQGRWRLTSGTLWWVPAGIAVLVGLLLLATIPWRDAGREQQQLSDAEARGLAAMIDRPPKPGATRVLLVGDSVAFTLNYTGRPDRFEDEWWVRGSTEFGCGIARGVTQSDGTPPAQPEGCEQWPARFREAVAQYRPDVVVMLIGAWEIYDREVDGTLLRVGQPETEEYLRAELDEARAILTARGAHLVMLTAPCFAPPGTALREWGARERAEPWRVDWLNEVIRRYVADHAASVSLLDLHARICRDGLPLEDGPGLRSDGVHFSEDGARSVWVWLTKTLRPFAVGAPGPSPGSRPSG